MIKISLRKVASKNSRINDITGKLMRNGSKERTVAINSNTKIRFNKTVFCWSLSVKKLLNFL